MAGDVPGDGVAGDGAVVGAMGVRAGVMDAVAGATVAATTAATASWERMDTHMAQPADSTVRLEAFMVAPYIVAADSMAEAVVVSTVVVDMVEVADTGNRS
jgi:hypothetical protein